MRRRGSIVCTAGCTRQDIGFFREVADGWRQCWEEPSGRTRSKLEERFTPFLRRHYLPIPRFNDWIVLGAKRYQADCHWPDPRLIVELDGWEGHGSRSAFQDDRARDRALRVAGYSVSTSPGTSSTTNPRQSP